MHQLRSSGNRGKHHRRDEAENENIPSDQPCITIKPSSTAYELRVPPGSKEFLRCHNDVQDGSRHTEVLGTNYTPQLNHEPAVVLKQDHRGPHAEGNYAHDSRKNKEQTDELLPKPNHLSANNARFARLSSLSTWFEKADPNHESHSTLGRKLTKRNSILVACFVLSLLVLILNVVVTSLFYSNYEPVSDIGILFQGSCTTSHRLSLAIHVLINVSSTLLLSASNMCMQLLVAPSRADVDKAHAQYKWLDIGVPSIRNLLHIGRFRLTIWALFGLASLPLHFV
jgi:hypothetical protein